MTDWIVSSASGKGSRKSALQADVGSPNTWGAMSSLGLCCSWIIWSLWTFSLVMLPLTWVIVLSFAPGELCLKFWACTEHWSQRSAELPIWNCQALIYNVGGSGTFESDSSHTWPITATSHRLWLTDIICFGFVPTVGFLGHMRSEHVLQHFSQYPRNGINQVSPEQRWVINSPEAHTHTHKGICDAGGSSGDWDWVQGQLPLLLTTASMCSPVLRQKVQDDTTCREGLVWKADFKTLRSAISYVRLVFGSYSLYELYYWIILHSALYTIKLQLTSCSGEWGVMVNWIIWLTES